MENRVATMQVTTLDTIKWGKEWEVWLQGPWNKLGSKHDHVHKHGIERIPSCLNSHIGK
jgi:hypothetical protein